MMSDRVIQDDISRDHAGGDGREACGYEEQETSEAKQEIRDLAVEVMEAICEAANLNRAYKRVKANKGAAGVDGMTVDQLKPYLLEQGKELKRSLLDGSYQPHSVREVEIPKPNGGVRGLGIPTVIDRFVQQAILQVLEPKVDPTFSESSYGFRPKRSAHDALKRAGEYVADGKSIVVDIDLEKFFDRVNHDILMSRVARRVGDKRLLKLIRGYLNAGIMRHGVCIEREEGTPQGGPLSPFLSNLLLDEMDKELERRGHAFCRYADDCNIYVRSQEAGERVMESMKAFLWKRLKLKLNEAKSAVAEVSTRKFLGYRILRDGRLSIAPESLKRAKDKIRRLTKRNRGRKLESVILELKPYLTGWCNYFRYGSGETMRDLDGWIRRKLRCYRLKQRKRSYPIASWMISLGVAPKHAWRLAKSSKGWWRLSHNPIIHMAIPNSWLKQRGLVSLQERHQLLKA